MKNMSKKVVFATGIFSPDIGGPATYVNRLAKEFVKKGFDVDVVTFSDKLILDDYEFPVTRILRKYPKGIRHFLFFLKLFKIAKNKDVIYAQNQISVGLPSLIVAKILKKKLILKVVGDAAWENYANRCEEFDSLDIFQTKKYDVLTEIFRILRSFVAKNADRIITPSYYLKDIISKWDVEKEKTQVVYNALKYLFASEVSKEQAQDKINIKGNIILSIGRLCPWKGFKTLIDIMPDLLKQNPNFKLVIVGEGQEKQNLENKIKELKIENSVKLTGRIIHKNIPLYFKASEMFVLNSEYEGLPHVVLEAMQLGVPAIISNRGGNPEVVQNNFNGFLVEYNNKEQIRKAIINLYNNKELQQTFIKNSKEKLKKFSWENLVEKTADIILQ